MLSIKYDVHKSEITIKLCRINITTLKKLVITIFLTYALKTFHDSLFHWRKNHKSFDYNLDDGILCKINVM